MKKFKNEKKKGTFSKSKLVHTIDGKAAIRLVEVKVVIPKARLNNGTMFVGKRQTLRYVAEPGKAYTSDNIYDILYNIANKLESTLPEFEFRLVKKLQPGLYTIIGDLKDVGDENNTKIGSGADRGGGVGQPSDAAICNGGGSSDNVVPIPGGGDKESNDSNRVE